MLIDFDITMFEVLTQLGFSGHRPPEDQIEAAVALRGRALYNFSSDSDEELSLQV